MSFTIVTDVFCDKCFDWIDGYSGEKPERKKAWNFAANAGWKKVGPKHYCPICNGTATGRLPNGSYYGKL